MFSVCCQSILNEGIMYDCDRGVWFLCAILCSFVTMQKDLCARCGCCLLPLIGGRTALSSSLSLQVSQSHDDVTIFYVAWIIKL